MGVEEERVGLLRRQWPRWRRRWGGAEGERSGDVKVMFMLPFVANDTFFFSCLSLG